MTGMTVRVRLALGFSLVIALLVVSMATGVRQLQVLGSSIDEFAQSRVPKLSLSGKIVETLLQSARQMRNVLLLDSESEVASELADVTRHSGEVHDLLAQVGKLVKEGTERGLFREIEAARTAYDPLEAQFVATAKKGDYPTAKDQMTGTLRKVQDRYISAVTSLIEYQMASGDAEARAAQESQARARNLLLVLAALGVVIAATAATLITKSLLRSLGGEPAYAARIAGLIAEGDLTVAVETKHGDRGSLLASIARMRDSLSASVSDIRSAAEVVGTASEQLAKGNANLSSRTEEQASALGETAASMEELTGTVKQNAQNAVEARALADGASQVAERGGKAMKELIAAMDGIAESSRRIAEIIGVIDTIAFQTNILALNAAVEAARAGEQGRGFAVVASEVRSLAHRSAEAAKEIKGLIAESRQRVRDGVKSVEGTGATIEELIESSRRVGKLIAEISEASGEQLTGIQQVDRAITQMDANTQQNAAIVEEAAAAAEHMASQAEVLVAAVSRFRTGDGLAMPVPALRRAPESAPASEPALTPEAATAATRTRTAPLPAPRKSRPAVTTPEAEEWKEF
jgi:methyl-accepting chemotaxis protein